MVIFLYDVLIVKYLLNIVKNLNLLYEFDCLFNFFFKE